MRVIPPMLAGLMALAAPSVQAAPNPNENWRPLNPPLSPVHMLAELVPSRYRRGSVPLWETMKPPSRPSTARRQPISPFQT
jgi:hypothetical protein